MTLCVKVLAVDNEEIVLVGLRIITELLKNYRPNLQNIVRYSVHAKILILNINYIFIN